MMKKYIVITLLFFSFQVFCQNINIDEKFNYVKLSSYEIKDSFFNLLEVKNKLTKKNESLLYVLKDSVSNYVGKFEYDGVQKLEATYKDNDNFVFVFSYGKRKQNNKGGKGKSVVSKGVLEKNYNQVFVNVINNTIRVEDLNIEVPDVICSSNEFACFLGVKKNKIKVVTFSNSKIKELEFVLPNDLMTKYQDVDLSDLRVVSNNLGDSIENIGAPTNRIFYDVDNLYLTYFSPKNRSSLILKFKKEGDSFVWLGHNELDFGFVKKVRDFNSYLERDTYYLVTRRGNEVLLKTIDLKTNFVNNYKLHELSANGVIDTEMFDKIKLGFGYVGQIPSLMVHEQKDSQNKIVSISYIHKETIYYDNGFHNNMLFQQQIMFHQNIMQQHQMMINNVGNSMPGGFNVVSFSSPFFVNTKEDKMLKFLIKPDKSIAKYSNVEIELKDEIKDSAETVKSLVRFLKHKIRRFKSENLTFQMLKNRDLYYAYYNKQKHEIVFGVFKH